MVEDGQRSLCTLHAVSSGRDDISANGKCTFGTLLQVANDRLSIVT